MNLRKLGNILFWIVLLGLLLFAANNFYNRHKANAEVEKNLLQRSDAGGQAQDGTKPVAPDFTLKDTEGKIVKLSDYKGKIVILNFWATWCPPCRKEIPDFIKLSEELSKGNDAVVLAVNLTNGYNGETADRVKKFIKENKMTMRVLLDEKEEAAANYGIASIPTTFIIHRDGTVFDYKVGETSYKYITDVINRIK